MARCRAATLYRGLLSSSLLTVAAAGFSVTQYTITALDPTIRAALTINDLGQTAGSLRSVGPFDYNAYVDFGLGPVDIGKNPADSYSSVTQLNHHGMASGTGRWVDPADPNNLSKRMDHAFVYANGALTPLSPFAGGAQAVANGINDSGQVAGWSESANGTRAFVWQNGTMTDLGTAAGDNESTGTGIDDAGNVVGTSGSSRRAAIFHNGTVDLLPNLSGTVSTYSVLTSGNGVIAGTSSLISAGYHSWILRNGQAVDLGKVKDSNFVFAEGVNDLGMVVGYTNAQVARAWVYDGTMHDLNDLITPSSGWMLTGAYSINDAGQIVGGGYLNGVGTAFIATPVPEPSAFVGLGFGAGIFFSRKRRAKARRA